MNIIGIICEYNPFHNGHKYHIDKIKELYPNSLLILVMSGYFTMRGEISILSKKSKAEIALLNNIDLVIELPIFFSSNSADIFASSAVEILDLLKCDTLVFGSESNNIELLKKEALKNINSNDSIKDELKKGLSYPKALSNSLNSNVNSPNDILGISYIKAIINRKSKINPVTIQRTNSYHDLESSDFIISASNIRNKILNKNDISSFLPKEAYKKLETINYDLLFSLLKCKIISSKNLSEFLTVDEGIENRVIKCILESTSYDELVSKIKTKRYTHNRIQRMLLHILIGLTKEDKNMVKSIEYIKILGFNEKGQKYLNSIKKEIKIPISTKIDKQLISRKYELTASLIYDLLTNCNAYDFEISNKPV